MKLREVLLGTVKERAAKVRVQAFETRIDGGKQLSSKEQKKLGDARNLLRRKFLRQLGVAFGGGVIAVIGVGSLLNREEKSDEFEGVSDVNEFSEALEITLGNVTFYIESPETFTPQEKTSLFIRLKEAYDSLLKYFSSFGDGAGLIMNLQEERRIPIRKKESNFGYSAKAAYESTYKEFIWDGGIPRSTKPGAPVALNVSPDPHIWEVNSFAHEFVHIYCQDTARNYFGSEAFVEGLAEVIEEIVFGEVVIKAFRDYMAYYDKIGVTKRPLDYIEENVENHGLYQSNLQFWSPIKWNLAWYDFLKIDPAFLYRFFLAIKEQSKGGKFSFNKVELVTIASSISEHFDDWYRDATNPVRDFSENVGETILLACEDPKDHALMVFNFKIEQRDFDHESGDKFRLAVLERAFSGDIEITYRNQKNGSIQEFILPWPTKDVMSAIKMPSVIFRDPKFKIKIGDKDCEFKK